MQIDGINGERLNEKLTIKIKTRFDETQTTKLKKK